LKYLVNIQKKSNRQLDTCEMWLKMDTVYKNTVFHLSDLSHQVLTSIPTIQMTDQLEDLIAYND
jgi:hypothetical protein